MSHTLKRLTIKTSTLFSTIFQIIITKKQKFLTKKTILPIIILRRFISKLVTYFMDTSLFFSSADDDNYFDNNNSFQSPSTFSDPGESLFLVPFRWWKEACNGGGVGGGVGNGVSYNADVKWSGDGNLEMMGVFAESEIFVCMSRGCEGDGIGVDETVEDGDLALVSEWMFMTAINWHFDNKDVESLLPGDDSAHDLFSLHIRLLYVRERNQLVIKISQKDNGLAAFNRGFSIFCTKYGMFQIWDFSGQTTNLLVNDIKSAMDFGNSDEEMPLELQIYGLSSTIKDENRRQEEMLVDQDNTGCLASSSSLMTNGSVDIVNLFPPSNTSDNAFNGISALGLTGLYNLGNTCFMNSAIQCLVHTPKLVNYFLGNFREDLNFGNPLGMNGKLAIAFGHLLRKLWGAGATPVTPRMFKSTISSFAPQFSGYNQHDSQEFLSFLLDGLHEDLNRVKSKPYIQAKDEDGRPDEEVADEYWANHLARNDSIIVDLCQGQYRSTLVCPVCKKLSITFDPFMYLSLPLPCTTTRKMTLTVLSSNGTNLPHPVTVTVPGNGILKDLVEALGKACSLRDNETLLVAEIYNNSLFRILDDHGDSIDLIRDNDTLVAYRLPKDMDGSRLVVFMHEPPKSSTQGFSLYGKFGTPLVSRMSDFSKGSEIHKEFLKLITPFVLPDEFLNNDASQRSTHEDEKTEDSQMSTHEDEKIEDSQKSTHEDEKIEDSQKNTHEDEKIEDIVWDEAVSLNNEFKNDLDAPRDFEYYLEDDICRLRGSKIEMDEPVPISDHPDPVKVLVSWPEKMIEGYDTSILNLLPEVCKPTLTLNWIQDSVSLYKCVDAFLKEEPLGPDDMWYCPNCKEHRQASKKLDLWRLPEILVIHLKRFSYTRFMKNKLETFVDFPVEDFDLSNYVIQKNNGMGHCYKLYAVSNHYGGLGGGHYTAFAKHKLNRWYEFDDSRVSPVSEEHIKNSAAYVLFYKRI